ncbi:MAG: Rne/Rng family ribonuclease [Planctomycetes bacterium]|nr:Rne/Rng family ribonuclease [Planctomycetota bacterium]
MVINVSTGDECRIAVLIDGRLEELFLERSSTQSHVGNIYKGRITNVEASIQAVFVDFGLPKNGFLHISDVQPQYFPHHTGETEEVGRKIPRHSRPPIQKCFRRGQEVIVQVTKEGVGTKGPTLTTYLSIPGRFLVMMPGMGKHGVSRKIEDDAERREMRDMLTQLKLPADMGFIMRTAGSGRTKRDLQRDLNYLLRLWKTVVTRIKRLAAPAELYQESDLVTRTIRDVYTTDFRRLVVDDAETAKKVREFLQLAMPRSRHVVDLYTEREPIFHRLGIEDEIDRINMRQVPLPSGGSIVIDSTEAMVAIDVNSGKFRSPESAEETAFLINCEAAEEIARQLRLRDLGGLIVCDFIDMRDERHKRTIERTMRDALKKHKERARILRMSAFGLIEITRQRQGPSLSRNMYDDCPHCRGSGQVKLPESVRLDVMRMVQLAVHQQNVARVIVTVSSPLAFEILNQKRAHLSQIESETEKTIVIRGDDAFAIDRVDCVCEDDRGRSVSLGREGSTSSTVHERSTRR